MIAVIHSNGTSFRGLMSYLRTGKDGDDPGRVAWTHTENLATDDLRQATAVMIATAKMQDQLKERAGIGKAGRKSAEVVQHITLSWAKNEQVDQAEMLAAARGALTYLGVAEGEKLNKKQLGKRTQYADQHQVVMVAHNDQEHEHVHLVINRVHPEHGAMLPENRNFEKLSSWALDYRRSMGRADLCPKRAINAAKRAQGYLTSHPRRPRNVFERDREIQAADPGSRKRAMLETQKRRAKELARSGNRLARQRHKESRELDHRFEAARRTLRGTTAEAIRVAKARVKDDYAGRIETLHERQRREHAAFGKAKSSLSGRANNAWSALKTKAWMTEIRSSPLRAATQAFGLAFNSGMQERHLERHHAAERRALDGGRRRQERLASAGVRARMDQELAALRDRYTLDRADLELRHGIEAAKLKAEWYQLGLDRRAAIHEDGRGQQARSERAAGEGRRGLATQIEPDAPPKPAADRSLPQDQGAPPTKKQNEKSAQESRESFRKRRRTSRRPPGRRDDTGPAGGRERD